MKKTMQWLFALVLICTALAVRTSATSYSDELTPEEKRAAFTLSDAFTKQWEQSGDMNKIVNSLYAPDFIERFLAETKREVAEDKKRFPASHDSGKGRIFLPGIEYLPALLEQASPSDWQRLYLAMSELLFYMGTHMTNQMAGSYLQGKEPDDDKLTGTIERIIPAKMREELSRHPILKNFIVKQTDARPIATAEEMKDVISLLEKTKAQVKQAHGSSVHQTTKAARTMLDKLMPELLKHVSVETRNESVWGLPPNTRLIAVPTRLLHYIVVAQINGQYKILWTEPITI
jgi:hypothetical protein